MKQSLVYSCEGTIWQVLPVPHGDDWLIEERLPDGGVAYCRLNKTGVPVWKAQPWPEKWWTQLAMVTNSSVLIREYADEQTPEHQHLHAINLADGIPQWDVDNFSLIATRDTIGYGYLSNGKGQIWGEISLDSGQFLETESQPTSVPENNPVIRPFLYQEEDAGFTTIREFILHNNGSQPVWGAEYLETEYGVGLSWYAAEASRKVTNHFWWMNVQGQKVLEVELGTGLAGIGRDTFWVFSNKLFYIKDKKELVGYAL
ncbi:MAG TPA: hypothetical protein DCE41_29315 [Cytophagales bacterium]|nr:hypothetical protein [Cytophagales bacterium]HAA24476.1 hypothetical protein [Cytophagales bacterium]HAP63052.1 hypothetical protein [Cytophagales bacterium]